MKTTIAAINHGTYKENASIRTVADELELIALNLPFTIFFQGDYVLSEKQSIEIEIDEDLFNAFMMNSRPYYNSDEDHRYNMESEVQNAPNDWISCIDAGELYYPPHAIETDEQFCKAVVSSLTKKVKNYAY